MRLGIITYHQVWNYGAVLQCAALSKVLGEKGHEVWVIDYRPKYAQHTFVYQNPLIKAHEGWGYARNQKCVKRMLTALRWLGGGVLSYSYGSVKRRKQVCKRFDQFIHKHVQLTQRYSSIGTLRKNPPELDCYICGSDQIWNPIATRGVLDEAYYLQFGHSNVRKVAYAASACKLNTQVYADTLRKYLKEFDFISLREKDKVRDIQALTEAPVCVCADPTLLLMPEQYNDMEIPVSGLTPGEYAVAYFLGTNEAGTDENIRAYLACGYKDEYVVDISSQKTIPDARRLEGLGPGEFLWLIHHAAFVMTNSFHAMVFSVLFKRNFVVLPREGMNTRVEGLAAELGLEHKLIMKEALNRRDAAKCMASAQENVEWDKVHAHLQKLREDSLQMIDERMLVVDQ